MNKRQDPLRLPVLPSGTGEFEHRVTYVYSRKHRRKVIRLQSTGAGRHRAEHTDFTLLADDGRIIGSRPITDEVAEFIIANFERRGATASFNIYESDLEAGRLLPREVVDVSPGDVRHVLTRAEQTFTSTGHKLAHHWPIFRKLHKTGFGSIVRATLTLHQKCSSSCSYCSTIARLRDDSISLIEAKDFVWKLYHEQAAFNRERFPTHNRMYRDLTGSDIRLRGLILSGGGQPNLWPHFVPFVEWLASLDIDLGLITNGFPKHVPDEVYKHFKWVRISITPEDASPHYKDGRFDRQPIPASLKNNPDVTVGYSYVYGPWTDDDILKRIEESMERHGFDYCRMLTDCNLTRSAQLRAHQDLSERLHRLAYIADDGTPLGRFFHQLKYHGTPEEAEALWEDGQCFLQAYNVFWDTTGHDENGHSYCYACDSITVLAEESTDDRVSAAERRFDHTKWGTVPNTEVERLFREPLRPYFDPRKVCSACLFMRNNDVVKSLIERKDVPVLGDAVDHVNFP